MTKKKAAVIINLFVGIMSLFAWLYMTVLGESGGALSAGSFSSLKYYTVLSNLFNGILSLFYVNWIRSGKEMTNRRKTLKLTACAGVTLTFLMIVGFFGPLYGYPSMFQKANFWFHLVLPLASIFSFLVLERDLRLPFRYTRYTVLSPFVYAVGYVLNLVVRGVGEWPESNDFYGFLNWGIVAAAVIAIVIFVLFWGISCVLWKFGSPKR